MRCFELCGMTLPPVHLKTLIFSLVVKSKTIGIQLQCKPGVIHFPQAAMFISDNGTLLFTAERRSKFTAFKNGKRLSTYMPSAI